MLYMRAFLAAAAFLTSLVCFVLSGGDGEEVRTSVAQDAQLRSAETEAVTDAETVEAVLEAVGTITDYMAPRGIDDLPMVAILPEEDGSALQDACEEKVTEVECCLPDNDTLPCEDREQFILALKKQEAERRRAEERRLEREKRLAEQRRIAAEKAAREAALANACPGYDAAFVATLTPEEQAEARHFYEQGFVFYRQNWSSIKDAYYGNDGFGQCGCGPTCTAAIISNLAGVPVDPEEMRTYGLSVGSWLEGSGTTYGFIIETAKKYGIEAYQIYSSDKESLFEALRDENKLVLATMGPGDFTLGAHFMLFRGITDQGKILIADSYSYAFSVREWDYEYLYAQLKNGYWIFEYKG